MTVGYPTAATTKPSLLLQTIPPHLHIIIMSYIYRIDSAERDSNGVDENYLSIRKTLAKNTTRRRTVHTRLPLVSLAFHRLLLFSV